MRMFMDGPEVSLNGSPTVSPTTAALCGSEPLPPWWPCSMYFFELSQAPPELAMKMARQKPVRSEERRVGKEWGSTCSSQRAQYQSNKKYKMYKYNNNI